MTRRKSAEAETVVRWISSETASSADPPPAWVVELVRSAEPICVPPTLKQRTLLSLGNGRPRPRHRWLRPLVACAVLMSGTAVASAGFTGWPADLVRLCWGLVAGPQPAGGGVRAVEGHGAPSTGPAAVRAAETAQGAQGLDDASLEKAQQADPATHQPSPDSRRRAKLRVPPGEDPALVVAATRALRVDRDGPRARLLATQYLQQHPSGALAEEALAIQVEAALEHHDADVTAEAARYLTLYPHGAFRAVAERALSARPGGR